MTVDLCSAIAGKINGFGMLARMAVASLAVDISRAVYPLSALLNLTSWRSLPRIY